MGWPRRRVRSQCKRTWFSTFDKNGMGHAVANWIVATMGIIRSMSMELRRVIGVVNAPFALN